MSKQKIREKYPWFKTIKEKTDDYAATFAANEAEFYSEWLYRNTYVVYDHKDHTPPILHGSSGTRNSDPDRARTEFKALFDDPSKMCGYEG